MLSIADRATTASQVRRAVQDSAWTGRVVNRCIVMPDYGRTFSKDASRRFYHTYAEFQRAVRIRNHGDSVQRYLVPVEEILPRFVRCSLSKLYFAGADITSDELMETIGRHGGCWDESGFDPSKVAHEVAQNLNMGEQSTARDRVNAVDEQS